MKILHIVRSYPPYCSGGTELYTQSLSEELSKNHEIIILYPRFKNTRLEGKLHEKITRKNIIVRPFDRIIPTVYAETYCNPKIDNTLMKIIKGYSPDVVHIQHLQNHSVTIIDALSAAGFPVIITFHDHWYLCPQSFLTKPDHSLCEGPDGGNNCSSCGNKYQEIFLPRFFASKTFSNPAGIAVFRFLKNIAARYLRIDLASRFKRKHRFDNPAFKIRLQRIINSLNKADVLISPSMHLKERYRAEGIKNILFLPHGIRGIKNGDIRENKFEVPDQNQKITFAYMGGITPHKGIHILISAFNQIDRLNAELLIYGKFDPKDPYAQELFNMIKHPNIHFMGFIEHDCIYQALRDIHAIVIPSLCMENYPLIANEAFITKTPVIVSDIGGLREIVKDSVSGFIFPKGDIAKLSEIMESIVKKPELLSKLSRNTPRIKTIEEHAIEIEKLYLKAIDSKRAEISARASADSIK